MPGLYTSDPTLPSHLRPEHLRQPGAGRSCVCPGRPPRGVAP